MARKKEQLNIIQIVLTLPVVLVLGVLMLTVRIISNLFKPSREALVKSDYEATRDICSEYSRTLEAVNKSTNFDPMQLLNKGYEEVC